MLLSTARPRTGSCKNPVVGTLLLVKSLINSALTFYKNDHIPTKSKNELEYIHLSTKEPFLLVVAN